MLILFIVMFKVLNSHIERRNYMCKTYTVGYMMGKHDTPFIRLSGKWLKEQGFNVGDKLKYISSKNMIILVRMTDNETFEDKK